MTPKEGDHVMGTEQEGASNSNECCNDCAAPLAAEAFSDETPWQPGCPRQRTRSSSSASSSLGTPTRRSMASTWPQNVGSALLSESSPTKSSSSSGPRQQQQVKSVTDLAALLALGTSQDAFEALAAAAAALEDMGPSEVEAASKEARASALVRGGTLVAMKPVTSDLTGCSESDGLPGGGFHALRLRSASALAAGATWLLPRAQRLIVEDGAHPNDGSPHGCDAGETSAAVDAGSLAVRQAEEARSLPEATRCISGPLKAGAEKLAGGVAVPLRRLGGMAALTGETHLRRWGADLAQLARRSVVRDQQSFQQITAPAIWTSWPEDAAAAASIAAAAAAEAYAMARPPKRDISPLKYVSDASFHEALESGDTVLVKGSWLAQRAVSSSLLPRRQELQTQAPEAIWNTGELMSRMSQGAVIIVAVSYCWLTREHPDPKGRQLSTLGFALNQLLASTPLEDAAIFLDWCSLYQQPRSETEEISFIRALQYVHLWYAHQGTRVWALSQVPADVELQAAYEERGWPCFERALGSMVTKSSFLLDLGLLDSMDPGEVPTDWQGISAACRPQRGPPLVPEVFSTRAHELYFTRGAVDRDFVVRKYTDAFHEVLGVAEELLFNDIGWGDQEVRQLATLLPRCSRLRKVTLHGNRAGPLSAAVLAAIAPYCVSLEELWLTGTPAGRNRECREWLKAAWEHSGKNTEGLKF